MQQVPGYVIADLSPSTGVAGQFEEVASVPVKVRASDMCEGEEVIITQRPEVRCRVDVDIVDVDATPCR